MRPYVVKEQIGTCRTCGKERDLREGYCGPCAPPDVVERVRRRIDASNVVVVELDEPPRIAGGELVAVVLHPGKGRPS